MYKFYLLCFLICSSCKANSQNIDDEKILSYHKSVLDSLDNKRCYNNSQDWECYWNKIIALKLFSKKINLIDSSLNLAKKADNIKKIQEIFIQYKPEDNLGEKIYKELFTLKNRLNSEYHLIADSLIENDYSKEYFIQNTFYISKEKTLEVLLKKKLFILQLEKLLFEKIEHTYPLKNILPINKNGYYQTFIQKLDSLNRQKNIRNKQILNLKSSIKSPSKLKKINNFVQKTDTILFFLQDISNTLDLFKDHHQESKLIADFMIGSYFTLSGKGYTLEAAIRSYMNEFSKNESFTNSEIFSRNKDLDFVKSKFLTTNLYDAKSFLIYLQIQIISQEELILKKL